MRVRSVASSVIALLALYGPASAIDIQPPANGKWAQFIVDKLDIRSFPSSLGNRRSEGKVTFADLGIFPRSLSAKKAVLGTDWDYTIAVLSFDRKTIFICFTDHAGNGGSYYAQTPLLLTTANDGKHLLGTEVTVLSQQCPYFAR